MNHRGQGTTEYLIILAIVIVIALVVVGVLGGFPSLAGGISTGQSKAYWGGTSPLAIVEWSVTSTSGSLVFQNLGSTTITLTDVNWAGVVIGSADINIAPGAKGVISANTSVTCSPTGQAYSRTLGYQYNTPNLTGVWFNGVVPLTGTC